MISSELIIVNSIITEAYILSYYDGIKEEVDIQNRTVFLWYDYSEEIQGEYWLKIKANSEQILLDYLSNRIGIRDLINDSKLTLCTRMYERYSELNHKNRLEAFDNINLPENEYLGYNLLRKLKSDTAKKITYKDSGMSLMEKYDSNSDFYQLIEKGLQTIKIKSTNEKVANDDFYPIAA